MSKRPPIPLLIAALGLLVLPPVLLALGLTMTSATEVVIFAVACMSLNILVGNTGLVSFGRTEVTGGENGLGGITRPTLFGFNLESSTVYYWFVAAIAFLVLVLLWRFHNSTIGTVLVAIRENEQRARFLGYPTNRYKLAAFVLSAAITGLAGILLLYQNRMTSADPISVSFSGDLLAMVVIGGMRSFLGPALGALFFILFRVILAIYTENWLFWF